MEISNILIDDTNGDLEKDLFKLHPDKEALSVWFGEQKDVRVLNFSTNNIRFDSIPNIEPSTYKTYLAYNGTLGYSKKVFSTVVEQDSGIFNRGAVPILTYNPNNIVNITDPELLEEKVIDIKMYNGQVDVITYSEGILVKGQKQYRAKAVRSFPTKIESLPNVSNDKVFLDGWYSYTHIIFRDVKNGDTIFKDSFYAIGGFIFKASHEGIYEKDLSTGDNLVVNISGSYIQEYNDDYEEVLFSLNEATGSSPKANNIFLHSQVLITDEIRDAILKEILCSAMCEDDGCEYADWQRLMLKRLGASVMFDNELYENAQIILESARAACASAGNCTE